MGEGFEIVVRAVAVGIGPVIGVIVAVLIGRRKRRKGYDQQNE